MSFAWWAAPWPHETPRMHPQSRSCRCGALRGPMGIYDSVSVDSGGRPVRHSPWACYPQRTILARAVPLALDAPLTST